MRLEQSIYFRFKVTNSELIFYQNNRKHGAYRCKSCKAIFTVPAMREMKTNRNTIPENLQKIIERSRKRLLQVITPEVE